MVGAEFEIFEILVGAEMLVVIFLVGGWAVRRLGQDIIEYIRDRKEAKSLEP